MWVPWPLPLNTPSLSSAFLPARSPTSLEGHNNEQQEERSQRPQKNSDNKPTTAIHKMEYTLGPPYARVSLSTRKIYNCSLWERHSPHPVRRVAPSLLAVSENLPPNERNSPERVFSRAKVQRWENSKPPYFLPTAVCLTDWWEIRNACGDWGHTLPVGALRRGERACNLSSRAKLSVTAENPI